MHQFYPTTMSGGGGAYIHLSSVGVSVCLSGCIICLLVRHSLISGGHFVHMSRLLINYFVIDCIFQEMI